MDMYQKREMIKNKKMNEDIKAFHQSELTGKWGVMKSVLEYLKIKGIFTKCFLHFGTFFNKILI